ncbi:hypothetical protein SOCEGT47_005600 [Sorangium cellulosum]|uniref:Uncharacterized protein n=1 Tax=Sorangium cellulosum TaxID=56 RepID=A0A4P2PTW2_SORCE|nr:hypothetical protein [Sorangium cellulosum]AUX20097.1 hypothetical protein SOCEGT47_005600 [Sorangium cellulosum]
MISHLAAGLFGFWPIVVFPIFEADPPDAGGGSQVAGVDEPGVVGAQDEGALRYVYSISCIEGSTGKKSFSTADDFCSALRGEQVCSESAALFALLHGCP